MTDGLIARVALQAQRNPGQPAVVGLRESGATEVWDWQRLWRQSERVAALLLRLGVRPGEAVAWQLANVPEFVAITLGVLRAGAVCCPLMPIFRERELGYMLARARARVLFVAAGYRGRELVQETAAFVHRLPQLEHVVVLGADGTSTGAGESVGTGASRATLPATTAAVAWHHYDAALAGVRDDEVSLPVVPFNAPAQLLFTSGTTGEPKGVVHRHDVLLQAVTFETQYLRLDGADRIYVPSPLAHQTGFLYGMWLALSLGATQIVQEHWDATQALAVLRQWGGTFVQAATPFLMDLSQAVERGAEPPRTLRIFVATGAAVPRTVARRAGELLNTHVCGAFGTTEGCLATLASPDDPPDRAWGTDGRALGPVRIRVCDDDGQVLPPGREGHYQTHSPTMFEGYLDAPEATAAAYTADGWYRTGDLAVIDADGYLHVTGRVKDVVNRGGEKVPVAEVEQLLYQHAAVKEVAIVAMPDPRLGERACAFVVLKAGARLEFREMQEHLDRHHMARQYWPERLELVASLPRTPSGKIQKYALRELAGAFGNADKTGTHR